MRIHPQSYALTAIAHNRLRLFQTTVNAELMIATLFRYRDAGKFLVHGFVVMPDHLHVLLTPTEAIETAAQLIKGGFSHAIGARWPKPVWQARYHAHRIVDAEDYKNQLRYIALNPVRKGWLDYPYVHTTHAWKLDAPPEYPGG